MRISVNNNIIKLFGSFSLVGLVTTLVSVALIFIFLKLLHTPLFVTYIGIYLATIVFSFLLNSIFVFKSDLSFGNGLKYFIVYLSGMLIGTLALWIDNKILPFENYFLGYLVLPFTTIWNFILSNKILKPFESC